MCDMWSDSLLKGRFFRWREYKLSTYMLCHHVYQVYISTLPTFIEINILNLIKLKRTCCAIKQQNKRTCMRDKYIMFRNHKYYLFSDSCTNYTIKLKSLHLVFFIVDIYIDSAHIGSRQKKIKHLEKWRRLLQFTCVLY